MNGPSFQTQNSPVTDPKDIYTLLSATSAAYCIKGTSPSTKASAMSRTLSSSSNAPSIKSGTAAAQTTPAVDDRQSPKGIEPSTSPSSADIFSKSTTLPSARDLFSNYPPKRLGRCNINSRSPRRRRSSSNSSAATTCRPTEDEFDPMQPDPSPTQLTASPSGRARRFSFTDTQDLSAHNYSASFPVGHCLNHNFVQAYRLEDELGSGGYSFVMTARDRSDGYEVAVKFIIKSKVPDHCWINDPTYGKLPMEVVLLSYVNHENVVRCLNVYEDTLYFYLVQELHGSPWQREDGIALDWCPANSAASTSSTSLSTPSLSPSASETSLVNPEPQTPPHSYPALPVSVSDDLHTPDECDMASRSVSPMKVEEKSLSGEPQRRPSYDLFECIEQSEQKRLSEAQARHVFAQVVDAVYYLHGLGIVHRDIKDENVVIDHNLKIKLIDFGSATIADPNGEAPDYEQFYGTAAYASSEILLKKKYKAAPAEVWTLGVLLSYLLAGVSPFPTVRDAVEGRIFLSESLGLRPSDSAMDLIQRCLDTNPETRIRIGEIKNHPWLCEQSTPAPN